MFLCNVGKNDLCLSQPNPVFTITHNLWNASVFQVNKEHKTLGLPHSFIIYLKTS